jgi:hypothetical protein
MMALLTLPHAVQIAYLLCRHAHVAALCFSDLSGDPHPRPLNPMFQQKPLAYETQQVFRERAQPLSSLECLSV